jgi:predicted ArsR family transcriptional regulator
LGELSTELKEFVAGHFHSVSRLEVLLFLSEHRDRVWSASVVGRKLNLTSAAAKEHLDYLVSQGLLKVVNETTDERYGYRPSCDELDKTVGQLSNAYAKQRVAVLTMIFANPVDKVRLFTETFRMIRGE